MKVVIAMDAVGWGFILGLFKPNVEKMEKKRDVEGLIKALKHKDWTIRTGAIEALSRIRDARTVEPLIQTLKDGNIFSESLYTTLGEMGDARAIEPLIQALKDEKSPSACLKAERALVRIGMRDVRAIELLVKALEDKDSYVQDAAAKAIGEIGDLRVAEATINWLFTPKKTLMGHAWYGTPPPTWYKAPSVERPGLNYIDSWIDAMKNLFGDYTALLIKASISGIEEEWNEAVYKLCEISTQISSNILHKISTRKSVEYADAVFDEEKEAWIRKPPVPVFRTESFFHQRCMAKEELERRGNPPYDPSVYLNKEAWKLAR